ncbi:phospholipase D family protein [Jannaschia rubra]|uniref:Phospholipase D n=1 Tax=Jannaschia rubra TaxID=282197 RepID=A0A0M6XMA0_9RHOB|nr:phospholipase D family protein [Jannaschia rubra]CTQ32276.1 putative cardiolipin synthase YwiE [Jannaschia rubra]SFG48395.1 Phosphatidylserine/phosphatidylglycerophosphate/cardiolipin synthase [Jannaschia rubra]
MWFLKALLIVIAVAAVAIVVARSIFVLPEVEGRTDSTTLPPPDTGPLAEMLDDRGEPGLTGIAPLQSGAEAFAARIILADAAVSSIDAQYYIWHDDLTGTLLLDALLRAADRGVRVRLMLDDNGTSGLDAEMAQLNAHENIEVRLYNPFNLRGTFKMLSYGFDFFRLNRRMHNKSFIVDGLATVVGGRNVGDEYFGTGPTALYVDLDVMAVGRIVPEIAADFDRYWASPSVLPVGPLLDPANGDPVGEGLERLREDEQLTEYRDILRRSDIVQSIANGDLPLEWTRAILFSDDPKKGQGAVPREDLLASRLTKAVGTIEQGFDGVSPYFVPTKSGVRAFGTLQTAGIPVRMLTNSLEATDVLPVHAGYAKHRKAMLREGVTIYELRRQAAPAAPDDVGIFGSSGSSLHAKTFAVDTSRIFVGSFNFDPRSTMLNTEMGLLIDSETMARGLNKVFDSELDGLAWRVELRDGKDLVWVDPTDGSVTEQEPGSTTLRRLALTVIGWLPVEWLL